MSHTRTSAGLLLYRNSPDGFEFFLIHPGGPYWATRDLGAWSIPKGEFVPGEEDALVAARREFAEETGQSVDGHFIPLKPVRQMGGKTVHAWAVEAECDENAIVSNTYRVQWPQNSGNWITVPEVDKAAWFSADDARKKINKAQADFIDQLLAALALDR